VRIPGGFAATVPRRNHPAFQTPVFPAPLPVFPALLAGLQPPFLGAIVVNDLKLGVPFGHDFVPFRHAVC